MTNHVSRLAPSPTGALHLGNARTFLVNWALARQRGWRLRFRIEDLDGPRVKAEALGEAADILGWLGIDADEEPTLQSSDLEPYREAMHRLAAAGLTYACRLSRTDIARAARAPHAGEHETRFPAELRPPPGDAWRFAAEDTNYRLRVEDETVVVEDQLAGRVEHAPFHEVGDYVVWTRRGGPSYQLAVVVDDARGGVTDVVRGDDLLPSAARQALLYRALGAPAPRWWHVPLVRGPDGRRLAKRHGDTRVATYRTRGVGPERIVGLLGWWCGLTPAREPMTAADFRDAFDVARLSKDPVTFTPDDHRWLLADS